MNNFEPSPFTVDGFTYQSVEHFYQCYKFDNFVEHPEFKSAFDEIRNSLNADQSKKLARKYEAQFEGKWPKEKWHSEFKNVIMKRGLIYKMSQNPEMLEGLLKTINFKLVESSDIDPYWGGILPGSKNMLGDMLMELRDNYLKEKKFFIDGSGLEKF